MVFVFIKEDENRTRKTQPVWTMKDLYEESRIKIEQHREWIHHKQYLNEATEKLVENPICHRRNVDNFRPVSNRIKLTYTADSYYSMQIPACIEAIKIALISENIDDTKFFDAKSNQIDDLPKAIEIENEIKFFNKKMFEKHNHIVLIKATYKYAEEMLTSQRMDVSVIYGEYNFFCSDFIKKFKLIKKYIQNAHVDKTKLIEIGK